MEKKEYSLELLKEEELSEILCVSSTTLRKWRKEGKGPAFIKMGKAIRYRKTDVESFIKQKTKNNG